MKETHRDLIPEPTIRRLPWYLAYVAQLRKSGVEYVSSTQISRHINVEVSRIAKDLSFLNVKGKTRIGYEVASLCRELEAFLGFERSHNAVVLGVGSLGSSLIQDSGLYRYGLNIVGGFDINPDLCGTVIRDVPVFNVAELHDRCIKLKAEIGIITLPVDAAQQGADLLTAAGIKALWNFTPVHIRASEDIVITNTSIYAHLAVMYNRLDVHKSSGK